MMSALVQQAVARIRAANGDVVGAGFALSCKHVMTCAHVVNEALGRPWAAPERPDETQNIIVDFPFSTGSKERFTGRVLEWFPPAEAARADMAVLELSADARVQPLRPARQPAFPGQQFWTVGFPAGQDGGMDAHGQLSAAVEHGRLIARGDQLPGFFIEGGYSGAPILDSQTAMLLGMAAMAVRDKDKRTAFILPILDIERAWPPLARPYQGLAAFRESDARFFKGRDRYVRELAGKLDKVPLVAVVGPSGSGKSSLVRAGLLPLLRSREDWRVIVFRPAAPTGNPFANLVMAMDDRLHNAPLVELLAREAKDIQVVAASLQENPKEFGAILRRLEASDGRPILLVGDQFEELFTAVVDPDEHDVERSVKARFIQALAAGQRAVPRCRCVLTIRADYMGRVLEIPDLASLLRDADVKLGPMTPGELREAITEPAVELDVEIDDELVSELLVAVGSTPDALPLLEFALTELWSQQHGRRIGRATPMDGSFGFATDIQAPLIRHAESVFKDMARDYDEQIFRNVMVGLVWIADSENAGQDTRHPRPRDSFPAAEWQIVEQLASEYREARLVTLRSSEGGEVTAEIAHEVLIRQWPRLQRWLNDDRAFRLWLQTAERDAKGWRRAGDPDLLYRGGKFQEALRWQRERVATDLAAVKDFIDAAEQRLRDETATHRRSELERVGVLTARAEAEERARAEADRRAAHERAAAKEAARLQAEANIALQRAEYEKARADSARDEAELQRDAADHAFKKSGIALRYAVLGFVFSALIALYAFYQWTDGKRLAGLSLTNETRALSALSRAELLQHHSWDALKLGLAAWPRNARDNRPQLEADLVAVSSAISTERLPMREFIHGKAISGALLSKDARRLLSWSADTLRLWDTMTGHQIVPDMRHEGTVVGAVLSEDQRHILSWSTDHRLQLWDAATGHQIARAMRHDGPVSGALLSKDGGHVLSWSADKTLQLWDATAGQRIGRAMRHDGAVLGALLTKNEDRILSWSGDNTLRLWDAATGQQIGPAMQHDDAVSGAQLSNDEDRILSWSKDGTLRLWDAATGRQIGPRMQHDDWVLGARLSKSEHRILSWSADKTLRLWDALTGQPIGSPMRHDDEVQDAKLVDDERRILSRSTDAMVRLWDAATGKQVDHDKMRHDDVVLGALLSKDERRILSWSTDSTLRLWDAASGQPIGPVMRHDGVSGALLNDDERRILSWSKDGTLRLWNAAINQPVGPTMQYSDGVSGALLSDDGRRILSWSNGKILQLRDATTGQQIGPDMQHDDTVWGAKLINDGHRIISWSADKTLRVWDAATGQQIRVMTHDDGVLGAQLSANERVLSWSLDHTLRMRNLTTGEQIGSTMEHDDFVRGAKLISDELRILSWSADKTLRLWDAATGEQIGPAMRHDEQVLGAELTKNERRILSWSDDKTLRLWNAATGKQIGPTMQHDGAVNGATLIDDERRILSWSTDKTMRLWDAATGQQIGPAMRHDGSVLSALLSKDEHRILSRSADQTLRLWDAATGQQIGPAMWHNGWISGAQLSNDGHRILSWSADTLRLWDAATNQQIGPAMHHNGMVNGARFSEDGSRILSWSSDHTVRLWDVAWPQGSILDVACALLPDRDLSKVSQRFGIEISDPICQSENGFAPIEWSTIERSSQ